VDEGTSDVIVSYVGKSEGDYFDLYHVVVEDRPVLEILIDPEHYVWIAGMTGLSVPQQTGVRIHTHTDPEFEAAGIDTEMICFGGLVALAHLHGITWMARVYVPQTTNSAIKNV